MPLYEYECEACGTRFEKIQKFSDPPIDVCEKCGKGPVNKLLSSPAIQFKGSGWYITDYAKKSSESGAKPASGETSSDTKTADAKTGETKTKTETPAPSTSTSSDKKD
jgi:putative FmdB family regulatory protein